jgi:hypothetical protein
MEASAAGLAGAASGDGGEQAQGQQGQQGAEGAQAGEQTQQQQGQLTGDAAIAQMAEQLQGMAPVHEQMREFLSSQAEQQQAAQQQQQQQQQEEAAAADLSFLDENSANYDPAKAAERLTEVMRQQAGVATQAELAKVLGPIQEQVSNMQRQQEADALVTEFPELGEAETAQAVVKTAEQYAEMVGQPELAANTAFIRMTYMAGRAAQLAQQQEGAAAAPGAATLEGAGGASPGGAAQGAEQTAESIGEKWGARTNVLSKL